MTSKHIAAYADFRRTVFDPKADCVPLPFVAPESDLRKAAGVVGRVTEMRALDGGSFNTCWLFETVENSEEGYVLRVPTNEQMAPSLIVEDWAAEAAKAAHVPVVTSVLTDISRYLVPFSFQILPHVEAIGDFDISSLNRLHSIHLRGYGPLDPRIRPGCAPDGLFATWQDYLICCLDSHLSQCVNSGAMTTIEAKRADELIHGLRATFDPVLLHGDLSPRNMLGETLIDWDSVLAGDPIFDLAGERAFYANQPLWILEKYFKNAKQPPDWERRFWIYYLRISIARTVRRARAKLPEDPRYPKASARIQLALSKLS